MNDRDRFVDQVSQKTNIKKEDIFKLAQVLQTKDLNNENDLRSFIYRIASMTNKKVDDKTVNRLIMMIKNKQVPQDFDKMI